MDIHLILVRHAKAEKKQLTKTGDAKRHLTRDGKEVARALKKISGKIGCPIPQIVLTSGYNRADETLYAFKFKKNISVIKTETMEPDAKPVRTFRLIERCLEELGKKRRVQECVIWIFGHEPHLSRFISFLSSGLSEVIGEPPKASLLWLSWEKKIKGEPRLRAFVVPSL